MEFVSNILEIPLYFKSFLINGIKNHFDLLALDSVFNQIIPSNFRHGEDSSWKQFPEESDPSNQEEAEIVGRKNVMETPYQRN